MTKTTKTTTKTSPRRVFVGVADHDGWAILVTAAPDGTFVDRRRVELVDEGLPTMPHHHDGQKLPLPDAVAAIAAGARGLGAPG